MTFELRGFYSECLDAMWQLQGQLPHDIVKLAVLLACNPRTVRKLLPQLIDCGKLIRTATGYYNPRMMADILGVAEVPDTPEYAPVPSESDANSIGIRSEFAGNSDRIRPEPGPIQSEFRSNEPKNPMNTTREGESDRNRYCGDARASTRTIDDLQSQLVAACNGSLANPAAAPGLLNLGEPLLWIDQGCDLERDVLPTLREVAQRRHGAGITSWRYFTRAVTAARDRRNAGLPSAAPTGAPPPARKPTIAEILAKRAAERAATVGGAHVG